MTAEALLKITQPALTPTEYQQLVLWGMFFSFAPDLDTFLAFLKVKAFWYRPGTDSSVHRKFYSHVPLFWMIAGLLVFFLAGSAYWQNVGLLLWLCSWSHFILDSIEFGVMWFWPISKNLWALKGRGVKMQISSGSFWGYWVSFLKIYRHRITFYLEVLIIILALIIHFK